MLSNLKEEKIKIALQKGYSEHPEDLSYVFLCKRLRDELFELEWELGTVDEGLRGKKPPDIENAKKECADVSNIVDFIFKKLSKTVGRQEIK